MRAALRHLPTLGLALLLLATAARPAHAGETQTLPAGTFVLDSSFLTSHLDKRFDGNGNAQPLLDPVRRYEPGAGLQGVLTGRPVVSFQVLVMQLLYGITDNWLVAVGLPLVVNMKVTTNLGWEPGDYQPSLGRRYSQSDFWAWAGSLGQPKPPDVWQGNAWSPADMIVGTRYRIPRWGFLETLGLDVAGHVQFAIPTGADAQPEEVIGPGTNAWELHNYADAEFHLAADRHFWRDGLIDRFNVGADVFYGWYRSRTYTTPRGTLNPLLLTYQPYVGDTYVIDPGDWLSGTVYAEFAPIIGPTRASIVSGGSLEKAEALPPLVNVLVSYQHIHCFASHWESPSAQWNYDREKNWGDGYKNAVRANLNVSLLRVGLPLQLYANYRNVSLIPGKNIRPADTLAFGVRLLLKFW